MYYTKTVFALIQFPATNDEKYFHLSKIKTSSKLIGWASITNYIINYSVMLFESI